MSATFRLNGQNPCLGTEFSPAGENSGGFCPRMKRGCLHTLESSAKYTKVLPQAKCRETRRCFRSLKQVLWGRGGLSRKKVPRILRVPRSPAVSYSRVILRKSDAEKTKSDSDDPVRSSRYTDVLQRQNRLRNEKNSASLPSANLSDILASRQ